MTPLVDEPAYLYTCTFAYANVNIQSEYSMNLNGFPPDDAVVFLETFQFDFD